MDKAPELSADDQAFKTEFDQLSKDFEEVHTALDKALRGYPLTGSMGDYILTTEREFEGNGFRTVRNPLIKLHELIKNISFDSKTTTVSSIMQKAWETAKSRVANVAAKPDAGWDGDNTTIRNAMENIYTGDGFKTPLANESTSLRSLKSHTLGYSLAFLKGADLALAESVLGRMKEIYGDYVENEVKGAKNNASTVIENLDEVKKAQAEAKTKRSGR